MPRAPQTLIDIDLSDTEYSDYKIRAASVSLGVLLDLGDQPERLRAGAGLGAVRELVELFASKIREWNLDDDNDAPIPVPTTASVVYSLDPRFALKVILTWLDGMTAVDDRLGKDSISGPRSAPLNFPMEPL